MMQTLVAPQHWALERSMRLWALTDEATRASVERSDGRVLRAVRQAFDECGFEADDAALRSLVVFAAGVGLMPATSGSLGALRARCSRLPRSSAAPSPRRGC